MNNVPKIFYNGEEIEEIKIGLGNYDFEIYITQFYDKEVSMSPNGVHLVYEIIPEKYDKSQDSQDDDNEVITLWKIEDNQDKITIDKKDTFVMIKWIKGNDNSVKGSLFIPMQRILHILTGKPDEEDISA
jgi:hypothetical protein